MGFTHAQRIQRQIISRRRTQWSATETKANNDRATGGDTGSDKTSKETLARQDMERDTRTGMDKAK